MRMGAAGAGLLAITQVMCPLGCPEACILWDMRRRWSDLLLGQEVQEHDQTHAGPEQPDHTMMRGAVRCIHQFGYMGTLCRRTQPAETGTSSWLSMLVCTLDPILCSLQMSRVMLCRRTHGSRRTYTLIWATGLHVTTCSGEGGIFVARVMFPGLADPPRASACECAQCNC